MKKKTLTQNLNWHSPTPQQRQRLTKLAVNTLKQLGRPPLPIEQKHIPISIKLDPRILKWAKSEAKRQSIQSKKKIGYQTIINQELLKKAA